MGWGTTDYDPVKGNLLVYTDNEPPFVSGDPQCGKCGGMEFKWVGTCVKCQDKEVDRWKELKQKLEEQKLNFHIYQTDANSQRRKHIYEGRIETLRRVLDLMRELEEK